MSSEVEVNSAIGKQSTRRVAIAKSDTHPNQKTNQWLSEY